MMFSHTNCKTKSVHHSLFNIIETDDIAIVAYAYMRRLMDISIVSNPIISLPT